MGAAQISVSVAVCVSRQVGQVFVNVAITNASAVAQVNRCAKRGGLANRNLTIVDHG